MPRGVVRAHLLETMPQGFDGQAEVARLSASKRKHGAWDLSRCGLQLAQALPPPRARKPTPSLTAPSAELKLANEFGGQAICNLSGSQHLP